LRRLSSPAPSLLAGKPSVVQMLQAVAPGRPDETFFEPTPGPGDSDGGDVYEP